ncbi:Cap15 family cyclic dinucleotide receptor domain-containing protein [Photobacterium swingsii]|uniref:Cap15 family cyclic dinucleotide receptor domain-containing protein n=1 Tax=Photobacterium swingsii TaxID=680026 RepID=UPI004069739B
MFRIVNLGLVLKVVVFISILFTIGLYSLIKEYLFPEWGMLKLLGISSFASMSVLYVLLIPACARKIWGLILKVKNIYPDLNGVWVGHVITKEGIEINVRAVIRQNLLLTELDMHGETVKSITLESTPTIEQGQKKLYYVYRSTPKDPTRPPYDGSTLLDVIENEKALKLSGKYYTDRETVGRIVLKQVSHDPNSDVSYY